jgi:hypothetical protein
MSDYCAHQQSAYLNQHLILARTAKPNFLIIVHWFYVIAHLNPK